MNNPISECWVEVTVATQADFNYELKIGPISAVQFYPASADFIVYLAAACWLLCDYIDTIRDEVTYVWKQSLCLGTFLFFALRYIGVVSLFAGLAIATWPRTVYFYGICYDAMSNSVPFDTHNWNVVDFNFYNAEVPGITYWLAPALQFPVFWLVEVVMQMRIFALYNSRLLAAVNGTLFATEIAVMIYLWLRSPYLVGRASLYPEYLITPLDAPPETSLLAAIPDPWPIYWIPAIVFELWLAGLALAKLRRKTLKSDLINVLLRDSLMYFVMIFVFMIAHFVLGARYYLGDRAVPFMIVGETVAGSRLVLHLRKAYFKRRAPGAAVVASDLPSSMHIQVSDAISRRVIDESFYDLEPAGQAEPNYISLVRRVRGVAAA